MAVLKSPATTDQAHLFPTAKSSSLKQPPHRPRRLNLVATRTRNPATVGTPAVTTRLTKPRVLFFDCETKPVRFWAWRTGKQHLTHEQIARGEKFDIICIAYKWLGKPGVSTLDWGLNAQDSSKMIETFTKVVESADLAVGHNGDNFDLKQINTQRLIHQQPPIAWPTTEDTLKQFRKHFAFPSYRLDYLAKLLTGSGKDRMGFEDWLDIVVDKKPKALNKMLRYCARDVRKLEQIYLQAAKYFTPKINSGVVIHGNPDACPRCGSYAVLSKGHITLAAGRYRRYSCRSCWHVYRSRTKLSA